MEMQANPYLAVTAIVLSLIAAYLVIFRSR